MNHEEMYAEFWNSLLAYVRTDDDGEVSDDREAMVNSMMLQPADVFLETMGDVPYDVAAIFSGCAGVREYPTLEVRNLKGDALKERLAEQMERRALPLRFMDDNPAKRLFEDLLMSVKGCELYRDVAVLLARGFKDPDFKNMLAADSYEMMERGDLVKYAAEEVGEDPADERSEDYDNDGNRKEEYDDNNA